MAENYILLKDYGFQYNGVVNQFLIDNELCDELRVVVHHYKEHFVVTTLDGDMDAYKKKTCLALEPLTDRVAFSYGLRGTEELEAKLKEYVNKHGWKSRY